VGQFAVTNGSPELVQQVLRQADVNTRDKHARAEGFEFADASAQLVLVLLVRHTFAGRPDPGSCLVLFAEENHGHTTLLPRTLG